MTGADSAVLETQVDRWVVELFGAGHAVTRHLRRTVYWLERLHPGADPALRLAALCHDVQRAEEISPGSSAGVPASLTGEEYVAHHQQRSAQMVAEFLSGVGADRELVRRVAALVASHEVGGGDGEDALMEADSISFFENSVGYLLERSGTGQGADALQDKFEWMYTRIRSAPARNLARSLYGEAMRRL